MVIAAKLVEDRTYAFLGSERRMEDPVVTGTGKVKLIVMELAALAKLDVWASNGVLMAEATKDGMPP